MQKIAMPTLAGKEQIAKLTIFAVAFSPQDMILMIVQNCCKSRMKCEDLAERLARFFSPTKFPLS